MSSTRRCGNGKNDYHPPEGPRANDQIRVPKVRVILNGRNLGVVPTIDAKNLARDQGLDLVEVDANAQPPVCRIIDNSKFRYEQTKRQKQSKQKKLDHKEIRFTPGIGRHDIDTKMRQVRRFLESGRSVKIVMRYRKRQIVHVNEGQKVIEEILSVIADIGKADKRPQLDGKQLSVHIIPIAK